MSLLQSVLATGGSLLSRTGHRKTGFLSQEGIGEIFKKKQKKNNI